LDKQSFVLFDKFNALLSLPEGFLRQLFQLFQHVLHDTHSILVTAKLVNILQAVVKEFVELLNGENLYDFLNEMGCVAVNAEFVEILPYFIQYQQVLLLARAKRQKLLKGVGSLFVHANIR
jgi:hypothetical protein